MDKAMRNIYIEMRETGLEFIGNEIIAERFNRLFDSNTIHDGKYLAALVIVKNKIESTIKEESENLNND